MSETASDSSSSKVDAKPLKRDSRAAGGKCACGFAELEKDALRVGTDWGRAPRVELGLRPDGNLGQPVAPPPELVRMDCREGEARNAWEFDVRGGWLAARSLRFRELGVSGPLVDRKRFVRSASSSDVCLVCGDISKAVVEIAGARSVEAEGKKRCEGVVGHIVGYQHATV